MSHDLFTILMICAAVIALALLTLCCRYERDTVRAEQDAFDGKRLREAAGSRASIEMAIESANLERLVFQKHADEYERAMRRKPARNVLRFPPITNRGRPIHFEPPSGGEAA